MNLSTLQDIPPWEWPEGTGQLLLDVLQDNQASESDLLLATELAGDLVVINDAIVDALLSVLRSADKPEETRCQAAIAMGPILEQTDMDGFDDEWSKPSIAEGTFHAIQESLHKLYLDADVPTEVRRRILEASVRAPQEWHADAIRAALSSDDEPWRLTAVFCMRFVRGFDEQILQALDSKHPDIRYEAVLAAGNWGVAAAWTYVVDLVTSEETEKPLLLAAIEAVASIRPEEAADILDDLADSDDEDVVEAVDEALALAAGPADEDEELDDDDEFLK